jgi:hypothetical protein
VVPPKHFKDPVRTNADTKEITKEQSEAAQALTTPAAPAAVPAPATTTTPKKP